MQCKKLKLIKRTVFGLFSFLSVKVGMEEWLASSWNCHLREQFFWLIPWHRLMHSTTDKNGHTGSKYRFVCISIYSFSFSISAPLTPLHLLWQSSDYTSFSANRKLLLSVRDYNCTLQERNPQVEHVDHDNTSAMRSLSLRSALVLMNILLLWL